MATPHVKVHLPLLLQDARTAELAKTPSDAKTKIHQNFITHLHLT